MIGKLLSPRFMAAFEKLKTALTTAPVFGFPDYIFAFFYLFWKWILHTRELELYSVSLRMQREEFWIMLYKL